MKWQGKKNPHAEQSTGKYKFINLEYMEILYIAFEFMPTTDF